MHMQHNTIQFDLHTHLLYPGLCDVVRYIIEKLIKKIN